MRFDGKEVQDGAAHVGLTIWGGTGAIPRSVVLLVRESSRETQVELDVQGSDALIEALTVARRSLADGENYLDGGRSEDQA
jgi:hypothetical protein